MLQGVYRKRSGNPGWTFVADQYGAGLLRITLELHLHLTWCIAAHIPAFSCVNRHDVSPPWLAPCRHQCHWEARSWYMGFKAGF